MNVNLVKEDKLYYSAGIDPELVKLNPVKVLTIEGKGAPGGDAFTNAIEALYPLAYGIRKVYKDRGFVFSVPKLEGLWWSDYGHNLIKIERNEWRWKLMIRMPEFVEESEFDTIKTTIVDKKNNPLIDSIKLEGLNENYCVQIMHIGPYATEPISIRIMDNYIDNQGYKKNGKHHEIYLTDPRKTIPQKMKTILRQPVLINV